MTHPQQPRPLLVGVAIGDVTPPTGIDVSGFCLRLTTHAVHRDLRASIVVFSDGETSACIVAADLVGMIVPYATRLREEIAARLGFPTEAVMVAASHTHNAPALSVELKIGGRQDEWTELNSTYAAFWRAKVLSLCDQAQASMVPARIAASRDGRAAIGINRRLRLPDGRMIIGRVPGRPVDHSVGVVRVDRSDGSPLVTMFNYACHPISLGPEAEIISPDYPGAARETVESITGAPAIFLQGAGGDVAPVDGMGDDPAIADALGTTLGLEAAKVWSTIETRNIERREDIVQSFNAIARLTKIEHPQEDARVQVAAEWLDLPLLPPPSDDEIREIARAADARLFELEAEGADEGPLNIQRVEVRWARYLEATRSDGQLPTTTPGLVQVVRVNGVTFTGLPVEPFTRIGQSIIEALGPQTIVCGYANGTVGYCPMPSDYSEGGYEVERAHHLYGRPSAFTPDVAGMLMDAASRIGRRLAAREEAMAVS